MFDASLGDLERQIHLTGKGLNFKTFARIGLHGFNLTDNLTGIAADIGHAVLTLSTQRTHPSAHPERRDDHRRHAEQDHGRQFHIGYQQHNNAAGDGQRVAQGKGQAGADNRLQQSGVGGQPGHDVAALVFFKIIRMHAHQMTEHVVADIRRNTLAQNGDQIKADKGANGHGHDQEHH